MNSRLFRIFSYASITLCFVLLFTYVVRQSTSYVAKAGSNSLVAAVDASNLVGSWQFEEGSGSSAIDSASGNNAILTNGPTYSAGKVGNYALTFDGVNDYAVTSNNINLSGPFTVSAWIKPNGMQGSYFRILETDFGSGFSLNGTSDGSSFGFIIKNGSTASGGSYTPGSWVLVTATFDGSIPRLYINGSLVGSGASASIGTVSMPLYFGSFARSPGSNLFKGDMDDVRLYTRALSSAEVTQLYADGTGGTPPPSGGGGSGSFTLTLSKSGTGSGTVSGGSISCGSTCAQSGITSGTSISLTAAANSGSTFASWSGCTSSSGSNCSVTVNSNTTVTATFNTSGGGGGTPVGGPGAGAHNLYVDQTLSNDCAGTYSIASRNCSGSDGYAYNTLQKASDASSPGNTVMMRGGNYNAVCHANQCYAAILSNDGTAGNMITYQPYNNESVVFQGHGFNDATGPDSSQLGNREHLLELMGDYIRLTGIELTNSTGDGLEMDGSFDQIDNVRSHDNWYEGMAMGNMNSGTIQHNLLLNVAAYNNRHGSGFSLYRWNDSVGELRDVTIRDSLFYLNGRNDDGTQVAPYNGDPEGGGNSDGITVFKECAEAPGRDPSIPNLCKNFTVEGSIAYSNNDDGFDWSADDSIFKNNIAFNNGPTSSVGFKNFETIHDNVYINNISYHNLGRGFEQRESSGEVLINNTSVENGGFGFFGPAGVVYNNISYMDGIGAQFPGGETGLDPRLVDSILINNTSDYKTNLSTPNTSGSQIEGNPTFYQLKPFQDSSGHIVVNLPSGSIASQVAWIKDQFKNSFSLQPGSPAIDAGTPASYIDPTTGQGVSVPYYGSAPDIGAYEYQVGQVINPPAPIQDNTPPTVLNLNATSITSTGATITWDTSEAATAEVDYGTDTSYSQHTTEITTRSNSHSQALSGLTASTHYYYRVTSLDASNNPSQLTGTFTTTAPGAPPVNNTPASSGGATYTSGGGGGGGASVPSAFTITNTAVTGTISTGVTVSWTTSVPATSQVQYGLTNVYGSQTALDPAFVTSHSLKIPSLVPNSFYYIQARSKDAYGNLATSPIGFALIVSAAGTATLAMPTSGGTVTPVSQPVSTQINSLGSITSWLLLGTTDMQVKILQQLLNASGYTVALSGTGSSGHESTYFGPATDAALRKFQCAKLAVCSGASYTTGYGATGPKTRSALNALQGNLTSVTPVQSVPVVSAPAVTLPSGSITGWLYMGVTNSQVKTLQQMLNAKGYTVAVSGVGSPGNESMYFGPATSAALKKFQCAKLSVCSGSIDTTGYGATGPRTRAALNQM